MSVPKETVWKIDPHTTIKHKILENYLNAWFPILNKYEKKLNYIDGFAGPGRYSKGEKGSPIIAIEVVKNHKMKMSGKFNFMFIEMDEKRKIYLESEIKKIDIPDNFTISVFDEKFHIVLGKILNDLNKEKASLAPTFSFIDPFGFSGLPFVLVKKLLCNPKVEVLITFMVDSINRFIENEDLKNQFEELFGSKEVYDIVKNSQKREYDLMNFYNKQLLSEAKARHVCNFKMCDKKNRPLYYLFFATNHITGFIKMKEAMWRVDSEGDFRFSDASDESQELLFRKDNKVDIFKVLEKRAKGKKDIRVKSIREFVEGKTLYLKKHLNQALKYAEDNELIIVEQIKLDGKRRRGQTFADDVIVNFKSK